MLSYQTFHFDKGLTELYKLRQGYAQYIYLHAWALISIGGSRVASFAGEFIPEIGVLETYQQGGVYQP